MEITGLLRKARNLSNPFFIHSSSSLPQALAPIKVSNFSHHSNRLCSETTSNSLYSSINSTGYFSFCDTNSQSALMLCLFKRCRGGGWDLNRELLGPYSYGRIRSLSASSSTHTETEISTEKAECGTGNLDAFKSNATRNQVSNIIDIIRRNTNDLESNLGSLNVCFSNALVAHILRLLNNQKVYAFRFFNWITVQSYKFPCNSDIYSLLIDNFGRLDDYEGMLPVLTDFRAKGIVLNPKAFGFLAVLLSNEELIRNSVNRVTELLNKVGGPYRISGIIALIQMLCSLGAFGMANFVIQITERRTSFYNIIIREKCQRCDFDGARATLDEMRLVHCVPEVGIYNYMLSCLCKNDRFNEANKVFEEMLKGECSPDSLTFEVLIFYLCDTGKTELAFAFLEMMALRGLEPRLSTHAAFVKSYFNLQRFQEAYQYAVDSSSKHKTAQNAIYSLLASLHEKRGCLLDAQNILSEMIDAGLRPNFPVYMRVFKKLQLQGRNDLANDLKSKFSNKFA